MRIIGLALCFLFITVLPAQARDKLLDIQEVTSASGVTAWLVEDHSIPVIALQFGFKGMGAAQDPADKQGLSRLASNTMDEGAGDLDSQSFQKELQDLSIDLHFNSSRDAFGGAFKTLTKNKVRAFELLKLALTKPRFDEEPVARMRSANQSRIRSSLSDPEWMAARLLNDKAFEGHPYAQNSGGTLSTLEAITSDDLHGFAAQLGRDVLRISVAGDINAEELKVLLDDVFGALPDKAQEGAVADIALQNQGQTFLYKQDTPQTIIEIMQPGIDRNDPDYQAAKIMNYILGGSGFGSRLMEEIREKRGLTYGIYSYFSGFDHVDTFAVSTSTKNESAGEMLSLIRGTFEEMASTPISAEDLTTAKTYLTRSLPLSLTSTDKISGLLLSLQMDNLPIDYLEQREDKIEAATIEDITRVAKRILNPEQFVTIMVGAPLNISGGEIEPITEVTQLPNVE